MRVSQVDRALIRVAVAGLLALTAQGVSGASRTADKPLARYVAKGDLLVYSEFLGIDAHPDAWKQTSTYQIFNETTTGAMLREVFGQVIDAAIASTPNKPPGTSVSGAQAVAAIEALARKGFVLAMNGKIGPGSGRGLLVIRDAGGVGEGKSARTLLGLISSGSVRERTTREDGRKVTYVKQSGQDGPSWAWWAEGDDMVVVFPGTEAHVDEVIATVEGKTPSAVGLPAIAELAQKDDNFQPIFLSFADLTQLPPLPPALGLSGLKRIDTRYGFSGKQLMSVTRIQAPAPRKGLLALIDQPTFGKSDLLPIPPHSKDYVLLSVDPGKLFDQIVAIVKESNPQADAAITPMLAAVGGALGVNIREDLLAQVGPKVVLAIEPEMRAVPLTPYQSVVDWAAHPPKVTAVVEIRDANKFAKTLEALAAVINRRLQAGQPDAPEGSEIQLKPLKGPEKGYVLDIPLGTFPLPSGVRPTLMLGTHYLVFSISPGEARKALAWADHPASREKLAEMKPARLILQGMNDPQTYLPDVIANVPFLVQAYSMVSANGPAGPSSVGGLKLKIDVDQLPTAEQVAKYLSAGSTEVSVDEAGLKVVTRESFPTPNLLTTSPFAVAIVAPAVTAAREAAQRSQSMNNLKQQMLAMHNYHDTNNSFPGAAICDAEGKPLLSWRVAILPFIEADELYKEFHLDEAWDSPHNKALIPRMPAVFKATRNPPADPFATFYQVFTDKGALFDAKGKGPKLTDVTDGTSNTIAIVEAGKAVTWTKPEDIPFDPEAELPKLGGPGFSGGFNAGFADGSVRFIKLTIDPKVLKALLTRAGGEVIPDDF